MIPLAEAEAPFSLDRLAAKVRASSNFHFAWQFFRSTRALRAEAGVASRLLEQVIVDPASHAFLASTFDAMYDDAFDIESPHQHSRVVPADGDFEEVLACAATDRLGAYSSYSPPAPVRQKKRIRKLFSQPGEYSAFQLLPGEEEACEDCRDHTNHLFSTWFYGVAWDWCLIALWPESRLGWVGCLSDTD